jgi:hypothetical protein
VLFLSLDTKPLKTMSYIKIPDFVLDGIINSLQQGYDVCAGVDYSSDETEKRPEYATGYSRATIRDAIERLKQYQESSN